MQFGSAVPLDRYVELRVQAIPKDQTRSVDDMAEGQVGEWHIIGFSADEAHGFVLLCKSRGASSLRSQRAGP